MNEQKLDNGHRDNHVVPATYYRNFLNDNKEIFLCKIKKDFVASVKPTSEFGIAYIKDFYILDSVPWDNMGDVDKAKALEKEINQSFEKDIPGLWKLLTSTSNQINIGDKHRVIQILLHLKYRNPYIRNTLYTPENMLNVLSLEADVLKNSLDPELLQRKDEYGESFDAYIDLVLEVWKIKLSEKGPGLLHNRSLVWREKHDTVERKAAIWKMVQSDWSVLETQTDRFITCDNPGFTIADGKVHNFTITGNFEYYFPLSSKKLLCIKKHNRIIDIQSLMQLKHEIISSDRVKHLNNQLALHANMDIYGSDKSVVEYHRDVYHSWRKNSSN